MSMLERAARALCINILAQKAAGASLMTIDGDQAVRAVLAAIREPSEGVLNTLERLLDTGGHHQTLGDSWAMLIDAILEGK